MTSAELAEELGIKESYLRSHWTRVKDVNVKAGIELVKVGRGEAANYGIKSHGDNVFRWKKREYDN